MGKIDRINSELIKQISSVIERDLKHPSVKGLISVTRVDTTNDLSLAKVYISVMGEESKDVINALNHSSGFIRKQLKSKMNIRTIPELIFYADNNIEYAVRISKIIDEVNKE